MGGKSGGGSQTTVQKSEPWAGAQPYLKDLMAKAQTVYGSGAGTSYYPFSTVVPFAPQTELALQATEQRALAGSPLVDAGQNYLSDLLSSQYLNNNPYLDATFDRMKGKVVDTVNSTFSQAGRYGSGSHQDVMMEGLSDLANQVYGENYAKERGYMQQALPFAPQYAREDYADAQALAGVGEARQNMASAELQDIMNRWDFGQNAPWDQLNRYNAIVQGYGSLGGTQTTTQPGPPSNTLGNVLGGLSSIAGIFSMFSDESYKEDREPQDAEEILAILEGLPIDRYRYTKEGQRRSGDDGRQRLGPMAQDWAKGFGGDGKTIPMPQMAGVILSALQGLSKRTHEIAEALDMEFST